MKILCSKTGIAQNMLVEVQDVTVLHHHKTGETKTVLGPRRMVQETHLTTLQPGVPGEVKTCRFYAVEDDGSRLKVDCEAPVVWSDVILAFKAKGVDVSEADLKAACEA